MKFGEQLRSLTLEGDINMFLVTRDKGSGVTPFNLKFEGVLATKIYELDSCNWDSASSFDEILESDWVQELGGKIGPDHHHYFVQTYDDVIEVVCDGYLLTLEDT